jgi:hypothetical protein
MDKPSPTVRALAQRLLAVEAASQQAADAHMHEADRVIAKLRISLTRFAGPEGFASLLRRALTLAGTEIPALRTVKLNSDGSLEGFEAIAIDSKANRPDVAIAITAHLLALLITFIGHPLTLRLVREAWPDARVDE